MYVCMYVCMCIYIYIYIYTYASGMMWSLNIFSGASPIDRPSGNVSYRGLCSSL